MHATSSLQSLTWLEVGRMRSYRDARAGYDVGELRLVQSFSSGISISPPFPLPTSPGPSGLDSEPPQPRKLASKVIVIQSPGLMGLPKEVASPGPPQKAVENKARNLELLVQRTAMPLI